MAENGPSNSTNAPAASAAPKKTGEVLQRVGVGPAGFDLGANLQHTDGNHAIGKVDPIEIQRGINQALGGAKGIEKTSEALMKQDVALKGVKASPRGGLNGLKMQNAAPVAPKATDSFAPSIFGDTAAKQADTKNRVEELLALQHHEVRLDVTHLKEEGQEKVMGAKQQQAPAATAGSQQKTASTNKVAPQRAKLSTPGMMA